MRVPTKAAKRVFAVETPAAGIRLAPAEVRRKLRPMCSGLDCFSLPVNKHGNWICPGCGRNLGPVE